MPDDSSFPYDIFLSHNSAQKEWTRQLARRLRSDGFNVWFDEWVLPSKAGGDWMDALAQGVEESRKVALVMSPEFFASSWPQFEAAISQHIDPIGRLERVIPLLHSTCEIPKKWGFRQALEFTMCPHGSEEFEFRYHHLLYNLDSSRSYEGDFECWKEQRRKQTQSLTPAAPQEMIMVAGISLNVAGMRIDPQALAPIEKLLMQAPKTIDRLHQMLDQKDKEIEARIQEAHDWANKYQDLRQRIQEHAGDDKLSRQATELLRQGDLDGAEALLKDLVLRNQHQVSQILDRAARDEFNLAEALTLQFLPVQALSHYEQAYHYRPANYLYAFAYALLLQQQNSYSAAEPVYLQALQLARKEPNQPNVALALNNMANLYSNTQRFQEAEAAYEEALQIRRELAKSDPAAFHHDVAMTLNNMAILYSNTQRLQEAEAAYEEALQIRRELAKSNPAAYQPNVATTLNNMANLYSDTQRFQEAEAAYEEALQIRRELAKSNPAAFQPDLAVALNNMANLYSDTQRFQEAEAAYEEALQIRRELAKSNPAAFQPNVATTLNNMAILYRSTQRFQAAEAAYEEALQIYRELAKSNPAAFQPDLAMTLNNMAILYRNMQRFQAAEAAYEEALQIYQELAKSNPAAFQPDLAMALNNMAILYRNTQRFQAAEAAYEEALKIYRELATKNPSRYKPIIVDIEAAIGKLAEQRIGKEKSKGRAAPDK